MDITLISRNGKGQRILPNASTQHRTKPGKDAVSQMPSVLLTVDTVSMGLGPRPQGYQDPGMLKSLFEMA